MKYPQLVSGRTVSGISGWLSHELDSHGLDGRVYARLVLSLLHGPARLNARDLLVENKQASKRISILDEDRLWHETHSDLWTSEQVKRYAAVECLKSASGENSGIESLVDELCVKLREIENEPSSSDKEFFNESSNKSQNAVNDTQNNSELSYDNPVELADKYYAAFPALTGLKQEKSISLFPNTSETSVWLTNDSVKKTRKLRKTQTYHWGKRHLEHRKDTTGNKMWKETTDSEKKQLGKSSRGRQEISKKSKNRVRNHLGEQWDTVWEFGKEELLREYINNQCNSKDEGYDTPIKCDDEKDLDEVCFNREWIIEYELNSQNMERPEAVVDEINMAKFEAKFNESVEALWNDDKQTDCSIDELNLPVDFQDLLSSPSDRMFEDVVDAKTNNALPGRTLKNSIWSDNFSEDLETECMSSEKSFYPKNRVGAASDEYKHQLELVRSCWDGSDMEVKDIKNQQNEFTSMPWHSFSKRDNNTMKPKWSDGLSESFVNTPFRILNHSKHTSGFREVAPKTNKIDNFGGVVQKTYEASFNNFSLSASTNSTDTTDDDLLTSPKTHFRPIKDEGYADGTTFAISSNIDHINYKICEDGLLAVASDTQSKRYMIYKQSLPGGDSSDGDFVIKFCVKQISKSCQTDEFMFDILKMSASTSTGDVCCCAVSTRMNCGVHLKAETAESDAFDKEIQRLGEYRQKWCTKCPPTTTNNNNIWTNNWPPPNNTKAGTTKDCVHEINPLLHIWSSESRDSCDTCDTTISVSTCGSNTVSDIHELKSELKKDGEEILNDLSYMQSLYIGSEWEEDDTSDKNVVVENETPFDVNKLISNFIKPPYQDLLKMATSSTVITGNNLKIVQNEVVNGGKLDRKRRHSSTTRNPKDAPSGECKKPNCKFSHEISSMPCQFWADNSCQPDGLCPYRHPSSAFTRPLTR